MTEKLTNLLQIQIAALEDQRDQEIRAAIAEDYQQNVAPKQAEMEAQKDAELRRLAAEHEQEQAKLQAEYEGKVQAVVQTCEANKKALAEKSAQTGRYTTGTDYDAAIKQVQALLPKQ